MDCMEFRRVVADRLDDLLDPHEARAFDAHAAGCEGCAAARAEAERRRSLLYAPGPVAPAPEDLPHRVLERLAAPRERAAAARWGRYAASFAAGVLATLAVLAPRSPSPRPATTEPTLAQREVGEQDAPVYPRRIR